MYRFDAAAAVVVGEVVRVRRVGADQLPDRYTYGCELWVNVAPILEVVHYPFGGSRIDQQKGVDSFARLAPDLLPLFRGVARLSCFTTPEEGLGFVHRDLKPANIVCVALGAGARMIDFGLLTGLGQLYPEWEGKGKKGGPVGGPHIFDYFIEPPELGVIYGSPRPMENVTRMYNELSVRARSGCRGGGLRVASPMLLNWLRVQKNTIHLLRGAGSDLEAYRKMFTVDHLRTFDIYQLGQVVVQCVLLYASAEEWEGGTAGRVLEWALHGPMSADPRKRPPAAACLEQLPALARLPEDADEDEGEEPSQRKRPRLEVVPAS